MSTGNEDTSANSNSTSTFVTALVTGLVVFAAEIALFALLHNKDKFRKVFQPRSYLAPKAKRAESLPHGPVKWYGTIISQPLEEIIRMNGFDAYTFCRFLLLLIKIVIPYFFLTWIILMPLNAASPTRGQVGLDRFTFGNVGLNVQKRYAGHLIVAWFCTFWTLWCIYVEIQHFIQARHAFLSNPPHSDLRQSRTVLLSQVPKDMMNERSIRDLADFVPGGVENVYLIRNVKELDKIFDERQKSCTKLEAAEGKLLTLAAKNIKKQKATAPSNVDPENGDTNVISSIVPAKKRMTRTGKIPFTGRKVNAVEYYTERISSTNDQLIDMRKNLGSYDLASTVIIEFQTQRDAIIFAQDPPKGKRKGKAFPDLAPETIYWPNMGVKATEYKGRKLVANLLTVGLIIIWVPLVAFVGAVSNLSSLCLNVSFLQWLCELPAPVVGILQGALPPAALAVLFILLPIFLRTCAKLSGLPTTNAIEVSVFRRYWLFLVIHGFLIITVASGLAAALPQIKSIGGNPSQVATILAQRLPSASIFFLTFLIVTGLSTAGKFLSQAIAVVIRIIMELLGGSTPRKIYKLDFQLSSTAFFKLWPDVSLLAVLFLVYSIIQPIICLLALVVFSLYLLAFKYLFTQVYDQPDYNETGGCFFPRAVNHIFVGLYIQELCLAGLFLLASNESGSRSAIPQGVLMIVLLLLTILFHLYITKRLRPKRINVDLFDHIEPRSYRNAPVTPGGSVGMNEILPSKAAENGSKIPGVPLEQAGGLADDDRGFYPPSTWQQQPTIWIAEDAYGLARIEERKISNAKVDVSMQGATLDKDGKTHVTRSPPDEAWFGGVNQ